MNRFRHTLLKFNHGVEIGAMLAYFGHYKRTKDPQVLKIALQEQEHKEQIESILKWYGMTPTRLFDVPFTLVGNLIFSLCQISPLWTLDFVAKTMEIFAIFNYRKLSTLYPMFWNHFYQMAKTEEEHKKYFSRSKP